MIYLSETFWRGSRVVGTLGRNDYDLFVFISVCQLAYFLNESRKIQRYLLFWMRYLPDVFTVNPGMFLHDLQIITNFLFVCQSFSWLTSLMKLGQYRDISCPGQDIFLKMFAAIPGMFVHQFHIFLNFFFVCLSLSQATS